MTVGHDGRIVILAAQKYGARGVGIDLDAQLIEQARANAEAAGVQDLVELRHQDAMTAVIADATVVTLYLLPRLNLKLIPQLDKLAPGSRIISHDWDMGDIAADKSIDIMSTGKNSREHTLFLWTSPLKKEPAKVAP